MRVRFVPPVLAASLGLLAVSACKSGDAPPDHAEMSQEVTVSAKVTAVDPALRLVTLQDDMGESMTVLCGPAVIKFDQIDVGDSLKVRYHETLAAARLAPGESMEGTTEGMAAGAAEPGAKPAAGLGHAIITTVRIESVDKEHSIVTFTPPEGGLRSVRAVRPEGQAFVRGLKVGDLVRITYAEALAVSVEEE